MLLLHELGLLLPLLSDFDRFGEISCALLLPLKLEILKELSLRIRNIHMHRDYVIDITYIIFI